MRSTEPLVFRRRRHDHHQARPRAMTLALRRTVFLDVGRLWLQKPLFYRHFSLGRPTLIRYGLDPERTLWSSRTPPALPLLKGKDNRLGPCYSASIGLPRAGGAR